MFSQWFQRTATGLLAIALLTAPAFAQRGGDARGGGGGGDRGGRGGGFGGSHGGGGGGGSDAIRGGGAPRGNLGSVPSFSRPSTPSLNRGQQGPTVRSTPQFQQPRQTIRPDAPGLRGNTPPGLSNRVPNLTPNTDRLRAPGLTPNLPSQLGNNRGPLGNNRGNVDLRNPNFNNPNRTTVSRPDAFGNRNFNNNDDGRFGNSRNFEREGRNSMQHWNPYRYNGWNRGSWNVWGPGYAYNRYGYGGGSGYGYGYGPWGRYGWYNRPWGRYAAIGLTSWALGSLYYNTGYAAYTNPYYISQPDYVYNYGQPIVYVGSADPGVEQTPSEEVAAAFQAARAAFRNGDYTASMAHIDQAVSKNPNDPALHEFRGLVLFAMQRYQEAAAAVYAVLSVGPGMNWASMSQLYPSVETYTPQLRALEAAVRQNSQDPNARFLLAYHYMAAGHADAARTQFQKASVLSPNDTVSRQMVRLLTPPEVGSAENTTGAPLEVNALPPAGRPAESTTPVLTNAPGNYQASNGSNGSIQLNLRDDGTFMWNVKQGDTPREFSGKYTLEGKTLALEFQDGGGMVGTVEPKGDGFHFAVIDGPPNDPGLDFARK